MERRKQPGFCWPGRVPGYGSLLPGSLGLGQWELRKQVGASTCTLPGAHAPKHTACPSAGLAEASPAETMPNRDGQCPSMKRLAHCSGALPALQNLPPGPASVGEGRGGAGRGRGGEKGSRSIRITMGVPVAALKGLESKWEPQTIVSRRKLIIM